MAALPTQTPDPTPLPSAYTPSQIAKYLDYINIPARFRSDAKPVLDIEFLTALHVRQITRIPYENLVLHYSSTHRISLDPDVLFAKLVERDGRGGYCMENSLFFNNILRALGFNVYLAGARVRPRKDGVPEGLHYGWVHVVNIVTLSSGVKYALDVGFGGDGPTQPMPLLSEHIVSNIGTQQVRLRHGNIPEQTDLSQKLWIYEYRNGVDKDWNAFYCFPEMEFLFADFEVMNWYTSCHERSFQRWCTLVVGFLGGGDEGDEKGGFVKGKIMLVDGVVKRNMGGKTEVVKVCKTEEERVEVLKELFGIRLTEEEREGIRGMPTELK